VIFDAARWAITVAVRKTAVKAVALVAVVDAVGMMDAVNELTVNGQVGEEVVMSETAVALWRIGELDSLARCCKMMAASLAVEYLLRH
jgi:hypothetical protein